MGLQLSRHGRAVFVFSGPLGLRSFLVALSRVLLCAFCQFLSASSLLSPCSPRCEALVNSRLCLVEFLLVFSMVRSFDPSVVSLRVCLCVCVSLAHSAKARGALNKKWLEPKWNAQKSCSGSRRRQVAAFCASFLWVALHVFVGG